MEDIIVHLQKQAATKKKTIVFPESSDERVLMAAQALTRKKIARILLVGSKDVLSAKAKEAGVTLDGMTLISPETSSLLQPFIVSLTKKRQHRGMTLHEAEKTLRNDPLSFGAMLVDAGHADGMVAGAVSATKHTIKAALQCVGIQTNTAVLSSFFMMIHPDKRFGKDGLHFFADCAVNPHPDDQQLAAIACSTAISYQALLQRPDPKVALLSFSTRGSATDDSVKTVRAALELIKIQMPTMVVDGELQFDAATVPGVGQRKALGSPVAGQADILIFPDLNSGNIAYKVAQRMGGAQAIGPIFQGLKKPVNDLSRGCSVDDIINVTAITALQCE